MLQPAPLQTTYSTYGKVAQAGMPASTVDWDGETCLAEDPAGAGIGFGLAVCRGTKSDKSATLGQLSGGVFIGITLQNVTLPLSPTRTVDKYADTENMPVMIKGDIWVAASGNVASGGAVYFNSVTGELGGSGIANAVLIHNARFLDTNPNTDQPHISFGGFVRVRLGASAQ